MLKKTLFWPFPIPSMAQVHAQHAVAASTVPLLAAQGSSRATTPRYKLQIPVSNHALLAPCHAMPEL